MHADPHDSAPGEDSDGGGASLAAVIIAIGVALRLVVAFQPIERLLTINVPDDAFYYFQVARSHAQGHGFAPSVTGLATGFHPLWASLLALAARCVDPGAIPRLATLLGALIDGITAVLLWRLLAQCAGPARAVVGTMVFALSAPAILQCTNGVETAVNVLAWVILIRAAVDARARPGGFAGGHWLGVALASALALLARTDNIFVVGAIALLALVSTPWRAWPARVLPGAAAGALALAPWLTYCWRVDGTILQSSAAAKPMVLLAHPLGALLSGPRGAVRAARLFGALVLHMPEGQLLLAACLVATAVWLRRRRAASPEPDAHASFDEGAQSVSQSGLSLATARVPGDRWSALVDILVVSLVATIALLTFHAIFRLYIQHWYLGPANALVAIAAAVASPTRLRAWIPRAMAFALMLVACVSVPPLSHRGSGDLADQANLLAAARYARDVLPGQRVGAFNSGILGFVAPDQGVNLDGVVNRRAFDAIREHRLLAYARSEGVRYVLDNATDTMDIYRPYWGVSDPERVLIVRRVFQWPGHGLNARIFLYEIHL